MTVLCRHCGRWHEPYKPETVTTRITPGEWVVVELIDIMLGR